MVLEIEKQVTTGACTDKSSADTGSSATTSRGFKRNGACDANALASPPLKACGWALHALGRQADEAHEFCDAVLPLAVVLDAMHNKAARR